MRDYQGAIEWYNTHDDTESIGFNPDGMCLAICRTARDLPARYPSAKIAQDNTPEEFRVYKVRDLRKGMVLYFDELGDSNTYGHIVTMIGRVKGYDPDSLDDIIVETNSVVRGRVVRVRASYFKKYWNDSFQFGAFWLNGFELDYFGWAYDNKGAEQISRIDNFRNSRPEWDVNILDRAVKLGGRRDVAPHVRAIEEAVKALPDDPGDDSRVDRFVERFNKERVLDMTLLNDAVNAGRVGHVKTQRAKINRAIKSVLQL